MPPDVITQFSNQGPVVLAFGLLLYFVLNQFQKLQGELVEIVKANTRAITELSSTVEHLGTRIERLETK